MSRLDAIADELGVTVDRAQAYTKEVRQYFEAAPSYAQILVVLRRFDTRPSVGQVVAELKKSVQAAPTIGRPDKGSRPTERTRRSAANRTSRQRQPTSARHKARYGRKKPQGG